MEVAQTAWDLQDLSDGRFVLGLGTQVWVRYHDGAFPRQALWPGGHGAGGRALAGRFIGRPFPTLRDWIGAQPQRDVSRLHRLPNHPH